MLSGTAEKKKFSDVGDGTKKLRFSSLNRQNVEFLA
jgi:hypothetical protein